jgi:hypothetical protein
VHLAAAGGCRPGGCSRSTESTFGSLGAMTPTSHSGAR